MINYFMKFNVVLGLLHNQLPGSIIVTPSPAEKALNSLKFHNFNGILVLLWQMRNEK